MFASLSPHLDAVYCIHLRERDTRSAETKHCLDHSGLNVTFFQMDQNARGAVAGNYESHRAVMQHALNSGQRTVLVSEDDLALLTKPSQKALNEVVRFLTTRDDWDILFLGTSPAIEMTRTKKVASYQCIRQVHAFQTHAYIASQRWMAKFVTMPFETLHVPLCIVYSILRTAYAVFPTWFYQTRSAMSYALTKPSIFAKSSQRLTARAKSAYASTVNVPVYWVLVGFVIALSILVVVLSVLLALAHKRARTHQPVLGARHPSHPVLSASKRNYELLLSD